MSRLISDILNAPEPHFSRAVQSWERSSNNAGHDIRLISEVSAARKKVIKNLGLDENDTTPRELYYALRHKAASTNKKFEEKLGIKPENSPDEIIAKIIKYVESLKLPNETWAIKPASVKRILKKTPPKKTLKTLGLRSIDSVLKRSNPYEILAESRRLEGPDWQKKINQQLKNMKISDFQAGKIQIFSTGAETSQKMKKSGMKKGSVVAGSYETGSILIISPARRFEMDSVGLALLIIHEISEVRAYSTYFRHTSVMADFGALFLQAINRGLPGKLRDAKIGWKPLHNHLSKNEDSFSKVEHPYFQHEHVVSVPLPKIYETALPDADFWKGGHVVFMNEKDNIASMHPLDVVINASNQLPFEKSTSFYLRNAIWEELGERYLTSEPIELTVIADLRGEET